MIGHKIYLYLNKFNYDVWGLSRTKFENIKLNQIFDQSKFIDNFDLCNFSHLISILNFGLINAHKHNFYNQQKKTMEELYKKINTC